MYQRRIHRMAGLAISAMICVSAGAYATAGGSTPEPAPDAEVAEVVWETRSGSLNELAAQGAIVVEAQVAAIEDGGYLDHAGIPTQAISMRVQERHAGEIPSEFKVMKTASESMYLRGDPPYEVGETYLLVVEEQGTTPDLYVPVAPDGRLLVSSEGTIDPVIPGPVATEVDGEEVADAADQLTEGESR